MTTDADLDPADSAPEIEADDRFPTGEWVGFFLQPSIGPNRFWMDLLLTFRKGVMTGEGRDKIGGFTLRGRYDLADGKCWWSKRYAGRHDVAYQGYNEGKGIWGNWDLTIPPDHWRGGFQIWPKGMADPTGSHRAESADVPELEPTLPPLFAEPVLEPAGVGEPETVGAGEGVDAEAPA